MKTIEIQGVTVHGLRIRTCNANEARAETARIGTLWSDFATLVAPHVAAGVLVFGVYHHYESDATGEFDVTVGTDQPTPWGADIPTLDSVDIEPGTYLVFDAHGPMPQAIRNAWARIWRYFADPQCPHRRAYTTDFERYRNDGQIEILIALAPTDAGQHAVGGTR